MNKTGIIALREFTEMTRKKSFIITTILTPLFMIGMMAAPSLVMMFGKSSEVKSVMVVDRTENQFVGSALDGRGTVGYVLLPEDVTFEQACREYGGSKGVYGVLEIGGDIMENPSSVRMVTVESQSMMIEEGISSSISDVIRQAKMARYDMDNLNDIMRDLNVHVSIHTLKDKTGDGESLEESSSTMSYLIGMVLGMMLYFIIIVYGQMVLGAVIQEKQSRVLDVLVTSCSPFQLMLGKILGVAAVAALQIVIWAALVITAATVIMPMLSGNAAMAQAGATVSMVMAKLTDVSFLSGIFISLFFFIVLGFLFYSSMYAAIGSSVDTAQDAQQFNMIVMMPVILSIIVMMNIMNDPGSGMVFWCSMIPFTSPIVMMARIPFGVPSWQIILSILILLVSFVGMTWVSSRIYRVGVYMHGRKPSWKDLLEWIKMD